MSLLSICKVGVEMRQVIEKRRDKEETDKRIDTMTGIMNDIMNVLV